MQEVNKLIQLRLLFNDLFLSDENTVLTTGAIEPFYKAPVDGKPAEVISREDFLSSALHEIAHWCIAGVERRKQDDFGYWYYPDGRTEEQQRLFEKVEVKPQAIEWALSLACDQSFHFSADNLGSDIGASNSFRQDVHEQLVRYWHGGLPPRAQLLFNRLVQAFRKGKMPALPVINND